MPSTRIRAQAEACVGQSARPAGAAARREAKQAKLGRCVNGTYVTACLATSDNDAFTHRPGSFVSGI